LGTSKVVQKFNEGIWVMGYIRTLEGGGHPFSRRDPI